MDFSGIIENVYENQGKLYMVTRLDKNLLTEKEIEDSKQKKNKNKNIKRRSRKNVTTKCFDVEDYFRYRRRDKWDPDRRR